MSNFEKYISTYAGRELLKKHSLFEYGIWRVRGEDPNCDFGGYHYMPDLGVYEGTLEDIIIAATNMPRFWTWGAGGEITKTNVTKVDPKSIEIRNEKRKRLAELENEVNSLKKELEL